MARPDKHPTGLMDRASRLALKGERPIAHIARDLGIEPESLRRPVRRAAIDVGKREDQVKAKAFFPKARRAARWWTSRPRPRCLLRPFRLKPLTTSHAKPLSAPGRLLA
jgi:hypothetical protein